MSTENKYIRYIKASTEYLDDLEKLEVQSFGVNAYPRHTLEFLIKNSSFFTIALCENKVIGYVCGEIEDERAHLKSIAVDKEYRMKGTGSKMLLLFENYLKQHGIQSVFLEVSGRNSIALNFYIKRGYRITGLIPHFYLSGEDAYILAKTL